MLKRVPTRTLQSPIPSPQPPSHLTHRQISAAFHPQRPRQLSTIQPLTNSAPPNTKLAGCVKNQQLESEPCRAYAFRPSPPEDNPHPPIPTGCDPTRPTPTQGTEVSSRPPVARSRTDFHPGIGLSFAESIPVGIAFSKPRTRTRGPLFLTHPSRSALESAGRLKSRRSSFVSRMVKPSQPASSQPRRKTTPTGASDASSTLSRGACLLLSLDSITIPFSPATGVGKPAACVANFRLLFASQPIPSTP
jgi:hypothetical protein